MTATGPREAAMQSDFDETAIPTIDVRASHFDPRPNVSYRGAWKLEYIDPCECCGKRHYHGGGDGLDPSPRINETGYWSTHCTRSSGQVRLRVAEVDWS